MVPSGITKLVLRREASETFQDHGVYEVHSIFSHGDLASIPGVDTMGNSNSLYAMFWGVSWTTLPFDHFLTPSLCGSLP